MEKFNNDLGGGVKTHDCNCRCYLEYNLMTAEEFAKATGKSVANDGNSDIIEVDTERENQRYGRNKDTVVNKTYINSGEYRRKFNGISDNPNVNRTLYNCAKAALKHRSGTKFEDMYWIDGNTGKIITSALNEKYESGVIRNKKRDKKIAMYSNVIAVHTHPSSMPPSAGDFNSFAY